MGDTYLGLVHSKGCGGEMQVRASLDAGSRADEQSSGEQLVISSHQGNISGMVLT
jgi:hypothetical protein